MPIGGLSSVCLCAESGLPKLWRLSPLETVPFIAHHSEGVDAQDLDTLERPGRKSRRHLSELSLYRTVRTISCESPRWDNWGTFPGALSCLRQT
ncbi:hypothetical protein CBM2633_P230001 [Cupriavidus taiwanensis]|nr:hypothetical protein CBM2633_P230001 [Cupriavidus taiwanensis]